MSLNGLLARFAGVYIALTVAIAVVFSLIDVKANSGVNAGALIGSVMAACMWFMTRNKRVMTAPEKRSAFLGMWAIDMALQLLVVLGLGAVMAGGLAVGPVLIALAFVGALHGLGIYFMVGFAARMQAKQMAREARA